MSESPQRSLRGAFLLVLPLVILLVPMGYSVVTALFAQSPPAAEGFLERPDPEHENCVRDTAYMRFHHWELLRQIREDVVRYGIRGDAGLIRCGECHKSRERFCDRCHEATSLRPDCWGCHYYP
jgi:hypothetical protein